MVYLNLGISNVWLNSTGTLIYASRFAWRIPGVIKRSALRRMFGCHAPLNSTSKEGGPRFADPLLRYSPRRAAAELALA